MTPAARPKECAQLEVAAWLRKLLRHSVPSLTVVFLGQHFSQINILKTFVTFKAQLS